MTIKNTHKTRLFSAAFLVLSGTIFTVTLTSATRARVIDAPLHAAAPVLPYAPAPGPSVVSEPSAVTVESFQRRIDRAFGSKLEFHAAASALKSREELMRAKTTVLFDIETEVATGADLAPMVFAVSDHQHWIAIEAGADDITYSLNRDAIKTDVRATLEASLPSPAWATVTAETTDQYGNTRLATSGSVRAGYIIDKDELTADITDSIMIGRTALAAAAIYDQGGVYRPLPDGQLTKMTLLAQGRSNYAGSPTGRIFNAEKALDDQLNGSLVGTGVTFSFNKTLKGASGWREALGIFEGGALRMVSGGGICQAATTLYRSLVKAGLPVVARAPHSLYVTYYKAYGVGIDATIFPGAQDLTFVNDTGHPILILARHEGTDAFVELYGTPDGRQVELEGPYFSTTAPVDFLVSGRPLKANEIGWSQTITWPDGRVQDGQIISRHRSVPSSLQKEDLTLGNAASI